MSDPYWRQRAACTGLDPEMFTTPPHKPGAANTALVLLAREALKVCGACPVRRDCDQDAKRTGVVGQIRAGEAYDDKGVAAKRCQICTRVIIGRNGALAKTCSTSCASVLWLNTDTARKREHRAA